VYSAEYALSFSSIIIYIVFWADLVLLHQIPSSIRI
jgi:hypothetical protein